MARSEAERTAKRVMRIAESMERMEDKGRLNDPHYRKLTVKLAEHLDHILDSREAAEHELNQTLVKTSRARKRLADDIRAFEEERDQFRRDREQTVAQLNRGLADVKRQQDEIAAERRVLYAEQQQTKEARQRYEAAVETFKKGLIE